MICDECGNRDISHAPDCPVLQWGTALTELAEEHGVQLWTYSDDWTEVWCGDEIIADGRTHDEAIEQARRYLAEHGEELRQ